MENLFLNNEILQVGVKEYTGSAEIRSVRAVSIGPAVGYGENQRSSNFDYKELTQERIERNRGLGAKAYMGKMANVIEKKISPAIIKEDTSITKEKSELRREDEGPEL